MSLAAKKRCLIVPETAVPPEWPAGWAFVPGGAMPPGWGARKTPEGVKLVVDYFKDDPLLVQVRCIDEYLEPTDALLGHLIEISQSNGRVKLDGRDFWSRKILMQIGALPEGHFGIKAKIHCENIFAEMQFKVFGHE